MKEMINDENRPIATRKQPDGINAPGGDDTLGILKLILGRYPLPHFVTPGMHPVCSIYASRSTSR